MSKPTTLTFEAWQAELQADAKSLSKDALLAIIPENVLKLWWSEGCAPTIASVSQSTPPKTKDVCSGSRMLVVKRSKETA